MSRRILVAFAATLIAALALTAPAAFARAANPEATVSDVSCSQAADCSAIATYNNSIGYGGGLFYTETNGAWSSSVPARFPANATASPIFTFGNGVLPFDDSYEILLQDEFDETGGLRAIDCTAAGDCTAIGNYRTSSGHTAGAFFSEKNGTWDRGTQAQLPTNTAKHGFYESQPLTELSCASAGNCVAVGSYAVTSAHTAPVAFTETDGKWSRGKELTLPSGVGTGRFSVTNMASLSCPASSACVATGDLEVNNRLTTGIIATDQAGAWTVSVPTMPADAASPTATDDQGFVYINGSELTSVSCPSVGACTAVGTYTDARFEQVPVVVSQTSTGWTDGTELPLPAGGAVDAGGQNTTVSAVECQNATTCTAVGSYTDTNEDQQGLLLNEQGGTWTGVEAALPNGTPAVSGQDAGFVTLSCVAAGDCVAAGHYNYDDSSRTIESVVDDETAGVWAAASQIQLPDNSSASQKSAVQTVDCVPGSGSGPAGGAACTYAGGYSAGTDDWRGLALDGTGATLGQAKELKIPGVTRLELTESIRGLPRPFLLEPFKTFEKFRPVRSYFDAAEKGRLTINWYLRTNGRERLVTHFSKFLTSAGNHSPELHWTQAGRKALTGIDETEHLNWKASFRTTAGTKVSRSGHFKLMVEHEGNRTYVGTIKERDFPVVGVDVS